MATTKSTLATTQGYPAYQPGQPVFLQPGTVPMTSPPANVAAPPAGAVMYTSQGGVMMPVIVPQSKPTDFLALSLFTVIVCGIFSPLSLALSIPGVVFSIMSKRSYAAGDVNGARRKGMCAAYFSVAAITSAFVVACVATALTFAIYFTLLRINY